MRIVLLVCTATIPPLNPSLPVHSLISVKIVSGVFDPFPPLFRGGKEKNVPEVAVGGKDSMLFELISISKAVNGISDAVKFTIASIVDFCKENEFFKGRGSEGGAEFGAVPVNADAINFNSLKL